MSNLPDLNRRSFARTNPQTIAQRMVLLRELLPGVRAIAEICCGDCSGQAEAYRQHLDATTYRGLDLEPTIVAANRAWGIDCLYGDALDPAVLHRFLDADVVFFGPPLSVECDGHRLLSFAEVVPRYEDFASLLLGELAYSGTLVCICPKTTTLGDVRRLYHQVKTSRPEFGLRLIYYSYATVTGTGASHEPRLKYVELWLSARLADAWEIRETLR